MASIDDKISKTTKFEFLPSEIFIECFDYLNGPDIIYAFDGLNSRLQSLIQTISLHVSFEMISKTKFDYFCTKMLLNPSLKQQVHSLKLSNSTNTCEQIETFLSIFSLNQFCELQTLAMTEVHNNSIENILSMLPSLKKLRCFSFDKLLVTECNLWMALSSLEIERLSIPELYSDSSIDKTKSITHLTISYGCNLKRLLELFKYVPKLKYLEINKLSKSSDIQSLTPIQAICLTTLVIKTGSGSKFSLLKILLKQTPDLKKLILHTTNSIDIIDASGWQHFISSSLIHLKIFKFKFFIEFKTYDNMNFSTPKEIFDKFQQCQNGFWNIVHDWYTIYESNVDYAIISTVPYYSNEFTSQSNTKVFYSNKLINGSNLFEKVTNLKLSAPLMNNLSRNYFPNVKSLILSYPISHVQDIASIKININLFALSYIGFDKKCTIKSSSILLEILKNTPNVSSMTIPNQILVLFFNSNELCNYLNRMIQKLTIGGIYDIRENYDIIHSKELPKFCQVFSNLEQLRCSIHRWNDLILIFSQLSKLAHVTVFLPLIPPEDINRFLQQIQSDPRRSLVYNHFKIGLLYKLCIWTGENIS